MTTHGRVCLVASCRNLFPATEDRGHQVAAILGTSALFCREARSSNRTLSGTDHCELTRAHLLDRPARAARSFGVVESDSLHDLAILVESHEGSYIIDRGSNHDKGA